MSEKCLEYRDYYPPWYLLPEELSRLAIVDRGLHRRVLEAISRGWLVYDTYCVNFKLCIGAGSECREEKMLIRLSPRLYSADYARTVEVKSLLLEVYRALGIDWRSRL